MPLLFNGGGLLTRGEGALLSLYEHFVHVTQVHLDHCRRPAKKDIKNILLSPPIVLVVMKRKNALIFTCPHSGQTSSSRNGSLLALGALGGALGAVGYTLIT